jgi:hypothetical protein
MRPSQLQVRREQPSLAGLKLKGGARLKDDMYTEYKIYFSTEG